MPNTITLHRVLKAPPERVYRAFMDAAAYCKWLPPFGFTGTVHHMDARAGGGYRMSFTNFTTQQSHSFNGTFIELVQNERIVLQDVFEDPAMPDPMVKTITIRTVLCGTELSVIQSNIPDAIPPEMCYLGWQESLVQLAQLVEPEIRG